MTSFNDVTIIFLNSDDVFLPDVAHASGVQMVAMTSLVDNSAGKTTIVKTEISQSGESIWMLNVEWSNRREMWMIKPESRKISKNFISFWL